jgi:predicted alpha-1,6-mannanase (GH76 family)
MRLLASIIVCATTLFSGLAFASPPGPAPTAADATTALAAFNSAFYVVKDGAGFYKLDTEGGRSAFWTQAEEIEMVLDAWEQSKNPAYKDMISELVKGFTINNGENWKGNTFNDDIFWMCIAAARAFLATGNPAFRDLAKTNFDLTYARAWDATLGGGLWWTTDNGSKNACVNGPAAIAACLLCSIYKDNSYLDKAKAIYAWERATLFDPKTGRISDNITAAGKVSTMALSYNQGTFIGAANYLNTLTGTLAYGDDARLSATFTENTLCKSGILPEYGPRGDGAGFNAIFVRWLGRFATDRRLWSTYYSWMAQNATAAWNIRRADNLSWNRWLTPTPDGKLQSFACSNSIVMLYLLPPAPL